MGSKIYLTIILLLLTNFVNAQFTVRGTVQDSENHAVSDVRVLLSGHTVHRTVETDGSGIFRFEKIPNGSYKLIVTRNKIRKIKEIKVFQADLALDILLDNQRNTLSDIEEVKMVKLKSVKSEIEKKGFAVNVIETKDAALRNLQTVELLDRTVGVRIRQNGGLGSDLSFNINGMSGNSIRILIDGIPVSSYGSSFDLNSIPPAMIERIEVYKGVVPGYIADDALGGAVNIILKKEMRNNLGLSLSYGSFNTIQSNFNFNYRGNSGFTANLSAFYNHSDNDYKVWGRGVNNVMPNGMIVPTKEKRFNDAYDSKGSVVELGFTNVKWADRLMIGYTHSDAYNEIQHGLFMARPYKGRFAEAKADVLSFNYDKKGFIFKNLDVTVNALYSKRVRTLNDTVTGLYNWDGQIMRNLYGDPVKSPYGAQQGEATIGRIHRTTGSVRSGFTYHLNRKNRLIVNHMFQNIDRVDDDLIRTVVQRSYMGTRDLTKNNFTLTYELNAFNNRLKTSVFGKYYNQKVARMEPAARVISGQNVRIENFEERTIDTNGYGIAASYLLNKSIVILGSAEKAVRLPSENELFGEAGENIVQNFSINPETSNNLNLGLKVGPYRAGKHKFSVGFNGFLRDTRDKIVRYPETGNFNTATQALPFRNDPATKSLGFDADVQYSFLKSLLINYNVSKFNTRFNKKGSGNYGLQLPNEPFFTMNAGLQYIFYDWFGQNSRFNLFYNYRYVKAFNSALVSGNLAGYDYFIVPTQQVHDFGVSYQFPKKDFIISLDVKNAFDRLVYDNFAVQKPGRAFYMKLNYTINNTTK